MAETSKAFKRRQSEGWFDEFAPSHLSGIDIGCQNDPLNETFRRWDLAFDDGDATFMNGVSDSQFQTVYASHVLEHLQDPVTAIRNWYRICRSGGHVLIVVPHRDLYERKKALPSNWNPDHRWFYLPDRDDPPATLSLTRIISEAVPPDQLIKLRTIQDGWYEVPNEVHPQGEYSIEAIIRKR